MRVCRSSRVRREPAVVVLVARAALRARAAVRVAVELPARAAVLAALVPKQVKVAAGPIGRVPRVRVVHAGHADPAQLAAASPAETVEPAQLAAAVRAVSNSSEPA